MSVCYYCGVTLTASNRSREHVIPDFLGGTLTSHELLCKNCNSILGQTIDASLSNQLGPWADLLVDGRARVKSNIKIRLVNHSGEEVFVGKKLKPFSKIYLVFLSGNKVIHVKGKDYEKFISKKIAEMGGATNVRRTDILEPPPIDRFYIQNNLSPQPGIVGFGGKEYYQAIAKIAINYALLNNVNVGDITNCISFIKTNHPVNNTVGFFNPSNYPPHEYTKNEVSNILYIKGDTDLKIMYCYIELLSFQCLIVLLSMNYTGPDFENTYSYDVLNRQSLTKRITIKLSRHHFEELKFLSLGQVNNAEQKLNRINTIIENLQ